MSKDKVAIITGGAQGLGLASAFRLCRDGAAVGIADLNSATADKAVEELKQAGGTAYAVEMNVANKDSVEDGIAKISSVLGPPTILVNNAGIYKSTPLLEVDLETWKLSLDVMLTGSLLLSQSVAPFMIEAGWGRIINFGSLVSNIAFGEDVAYCTAKTGMLGFTRSLAAELAKHNICVNTVCPGNILTDMLREGGRAIEKRDGLEEGSWLEGRHKDIPLGRLGEPDDIAKIIGFLCSEDADYITGQTLHVNGGLYQH